MAKLLFSTVEETEAMPEFPVQCVACREMHAGDLQKAIADGWHISVYETLTQGHVQYAGCPLHFKEWEKESFAFFKSVTN